MGGLRASPRTDFATLPASGGALGTDPYVVRAAPAVIAGPVRFAGILRGRDALVELGDDLRELGRLPTPASPTGVAFTATGEVLVVGELEGRVARYGWRDGRLRATGSIERPGIRAMRDVATGPEGVVYVVEEHDGQLLTLTPAPGPGAAPPAERLATPLCHGPLHVLRVARSLVVDCLLDHVVIVRGVDGRGRPVAAGEVRIAHDGPMWGVDATAEGDGLLVAVGGVEDHPLDRTEGSFGFVDSFVTVYRVGAGTARKLAEVNTSELGVVTPKAVHLSLGAGRLGLAVAGYASDRLALLEWDRAAGSVAELGAPRVSTRPIPAGAAMMEALADGSLVLADPLVDAWVRSSPAGRVVEHVDDVASLARSSDSRLGEALFFTTLMAPWDKSEGRLSRFTCETCHFEGYVDGRTHHTGRGDVRATTKPLVGLFNNRPHFSRALDPDMTTMVNNEFRVAGAKSDHDPGSRCRRRTSHGCRSSGCAIDRRGHSTCAARHDLLHGLHPPRQSLGGRTHDVHPDIERAGAEVFRARCESCHEARLVADEPGSRVPFERWQGLVLSASDPIVWAHAEYEKTGVEPYVNEHGARVVSLRRLYKKHPYFTNGSAPEIRRRPRSRALRRRRVPP